MVGGGSAKSDRVNDERRMGVEKKVRLKSKVGSKKAFIRPATSKYSIAGGAHRGERDNRGWGWRQIDSALWKNQVLAQILNLAPILKKGWAQEREDKSQKLKGFVGGCLPGGWRYKILEEYLHCSGIGGKKRRRVHS